MSNLVVQRLGVNYTNSPRFTLTIVPSRAAGAQPTEHFVSKSPRPEMMRVDISKPQPPFECPPDTSLIAELRRYIGPPETLFDVAGLDFQQFPSVWDVPANSTSVFCDESCFNTPTNTPSPLCFSDEWDSPSKSSDTHYAPDSPLFFDLYEDIVVPTPLIGLIGTAATPPSKTCGCSTSPRYQIIHNRNLQQRTHTCCGVVFCTRKLRTIHRQQYGHV